MHGAANRRLERWLGDQRGPLESLAESDALPPLEVATGGLDRKKHCLLVRLLGRGY